MKALKSKIIEIFFEMLLKEDLTDGSEAKLKRFAYISTRNRDSVDINPFGLLLLSHFFFQNISGSSRVASFASIYIQKFRKNNFYFM